MKLAMLLLAVVLAMLPVANSQLPSPEELGADYPEDPTMRQSRQVNPEEMVQNILQWLQGVYKNNNRRARQNGGYLPPAGQNAERPRPFQRPTSQKPYKPSTFEPSTSAPYQPSSNTPYQPSGAPFSPSGSSSLAPYPPSSQQYPDYSQSGYPLAGPSPQPPFISPNPDYDSDFGNGIKPGPSTNAPYVPPSTSGYRPSTLPPTYQTTTFAPEPTFQPNEVSYKPIPTNPPPSPTYRPSTTPSYNKPQLQVNPDDDKHPPHIHDIDVQCAKDMMTINVEFNRVYNGIIYSKGFYSNSNCRYVQENSNQIKYTFTLSLNSCGTEFINGFDTQGQSYLENVLVLQNEPGIQEVWDSIKSVRCLWEGNLNKQLSVALSVGMLNQETVTFSGDTAMASLDIQVGRGPFAPQANGLVKIGETMTLVISITGDPGFDIQVKDCIARDADSENVVRLTDDNGCILKPKLFGAFQKTRDTGNTGTSIIAYAFFSAFKFPDVMDLIMECNVELCKTNCEICLEPNQQLEPGRRRRRDTFGANETLVDPVRVGKGLKVILPEDISLPEPLGVCVSYSGFLWGSTFILIVLAFSCISAGLMWLKLQKHTQCKNHM